MGREEMGQEKGKEWELEVICKMKSKNFNIKMKQNEQQKKEITGYRFIKTERRMLVVGVEN